MGKYLSHEIGFVESNDMLFFGESKPNLRSQQAAVLMLLFTTFFQNISSKKMSEKNQSNPALKSVPQILNSHCHSGIFFSKSRARVKGIHRHVVKSIPHLAVEPFMERIIHMDDGEEWITGG